MCMLKYLLIKPKKIFERFICFLKVILYFRVFSFYSKCIFVFFFLQKLVQRSFHEKLTTHSFSRNVFKGN